MKLTLDVVRNNASVEEVIITDVAHFSVDETSINLHFNDGENEIISLRDNSGEGDHDWAYLSIAALRVGMRVDTTK